MSKKCVRCRIEKPFEEFHKRQKKYSKDGRRGTCIDCRKIESIENRRETKNRALKRAYGINIDDYERMLAEQNYRCKICKTSETGNRYECLVVDHCHRSSKVRGLLCNNCNRVLGLVKEKETTFRSMIEYLKICNSDNTNL